MFKFYIPLQKGIDIQPYQNYPVPVVRVTAHVEELAANQDMASLAEKSQAILDSNRAQIQHWCNARRQEYSLNSNTVDKKTYELDKALLVHTILFNQEIIEIHVYPETSEEEEKELHLMIVSGNQIYAIPMTQIDAVPSTVNLRIAYTKTLEDTMLYSGGDYYRQYKFRGAATGFLLANKHIHDTWIEHVAARRLTPVTETLNFSAEISGYDNLISGVGQTVQLLSGEYKYTGGSVERTVTRTGASGFDAIDSTGRGYARIGPNSVITTDTITNPSIDYDSYFANIILYFYTDTGTGAYTAPAFSGAARQSEFDAYEPYWPESAAAPLTEFMSGSVDLNSASVISTYTASYTYNFWSTTNWWDVTPGDLDRTEAPISAFSGSIVLPVFSTGSGDVIEARPYSFSGNISVSVTSLSPPVGSSDIANSTMTFNFGAYSISYSKTDANRVVPNVINYALPITNPLVGFNVITSMPAADGICMMYNQITKQHNDWFGNPTDTDFKEFRFYHPVEETPLVFSDFQQTITAIGHVSNGRSYIQAYKIAPANVTRVYCNGIDIYPALQALGISSWNLMVMDVPLGRIKKFT